MRTIFRALRKIGLLRSIALFMIGVIIGGVIKGAYHAATNLIPEPIPLKLKDRIPFPRIPHAER